MERVLSFLLWNLLAYGLKESGRFSPEVGLRKRGPASGAACTTAGEATRDSEQFGAKTFAAIPWFTVQALFGKVHFKRLAAAAVHIWPNKERAACFKDRCAFCRHLNSACRGIFFREEAEPDLPFLTATSLSIWSWPPALHHSQNLAGQELVTDAGAIWRMLIFGLGCLRPSRSQS